MQIDTMDICQLLNTMHWVDTKPGELVRVT